MTDFQYWAFISYSHHEEKLARRLAQSIERYRLPRNLAAPANTQLPQRLFPVFRDREELSGSGALGPTLSRALSNSRTLIVLCSPEAASSHWVPNEIRTFRGIRGNEAILPVLVRTDPAKAFPPELLRASNESASNSYEPIAVDMRPGRDSMRVATLRLVAGILGIPFDALQQRDATARRRRRIVYNAAAASLIALALLAATLISRSRSQALAEKFLTKAAELENTRSDEALVLTVQADVVGPSSNTLEKIRRLLDNRSRVLQYFPFSATLIAFGREPILYAIKEPPGDRLLARVLLGNVKGAARPQFEDPTEKTSFMSLALSDDGTAVASKAFGSDVFVWDTKVGRLLRTIPISPNADLGPPNRLRFVNDNTLDILMGEFVQVDIPSGRTRRIFVDSQPNLVLSPDGTISSLTNGMLTIFDPLDGTVKEQHPVPPNAIDNSAYAVGSSGGILVSLMSNTGNVRVIAFNYLTGKTWDSGLFESTGPTTFALSPDASMVAILSGELLRLWPTNPVANGIYMNSTVDDDPSIIRIDYRSHSSVVTASLSEVNTPESAMAFNADSSLIAVSTTDLNTAVYFTQIPERPNSASQPAQSREELRRRACEMANLDSQSLVKEIGQGAYCLRFQ